MKKILYCSVMLSFIFCLFSCRTTKINEDTGSLHTINLSNNSAWKDTLENSKEEVKTKWLEFIKYDLNYLKERFNITLSEEEIPYLVLIPIEIFVIDSISFASLNKDTSIKDIVTLKIDKAYFDVARGSNDLLININVTMRNGKWDSIGYGKIAHTLVPVLSELYFEKKHPLYVIGVDNNPSSKYIKEFNVYYDGKKYMNLDIFGQSKPFIDELLEYRNYLDSMRE